MGKKKSRKGTKPQPCIKMKHRKGEREKICKKSERGKYSERETE